MNPSSSINCYIFLIYRRCKKQEHTLDRLPVHHSMHIPKLNSKQIEVRDCVSCENLRSILTPLKRPRSWIWRMKYSSYSRSACHLLKLLPFNNFNRWQHGNSSFFAICAKTTFPFLFPVQIWSWLVKNGFSCTAFKGSGKHSVTQISANLGESPTICYFNRAWFSLLN